MSMPSIDLIEAELREINIGILGNEGWAPGYANQPEYFKLLLGLESDMERVFRDYLRGLSHRISSYVAWSKYHQDVVAVQADDDDYDVSVLFDDDSFEDDEGLQVQNLIREIYIDGVAIGFAAERNHVTGVTGTVTKTVESPAWKAVQEASETHIKQLAQWLDDTTAKQVVDSIQKSIALGESQELAMQRLTDVVDDVKRAARIARTEAVRAWSIGAHTFAKLNGATSKTWRALPGADAGRSQQPCLDNAGSTVAIDDTFPSGVDYTPAHVNCRCKVDYIYPDDYEIPVPSA